MRHLLVVLLCWSCIEARAQAPVMDSIDLATGGAIYAGASGSQSLGIYPPVYNGRHFYGYSPLYKGHAFYDVWDWSPGSVVYDDIYYKNVNLMFDLYKGEVLVRLPNGLGIILFTERVREFSLTGHRFVYVEKDRSEGRPAGFYHVLVEGNVSLYVKRAKQLIERFEALTIEREFLPSDTFFAVKAGKWRRINSPRILFNVLGGHRNEIQRNLKRLHLKFRRDREQYLVAAIKHYNQITR